MLSLHKVTTVLAGAYMLNEQTLQYKNEIQERTKFQCIQLSRRAKTPEITAL